MSTSTSNNKQEPAYCNGCGSVLDGYYSYTCPYCGFEYCYDCFKRVLIAETGCPNRLGTLWL